MKKYLCIAIAVIALVAFVSCGSDPVDNEDEIRVLVPQFMQSTAKKGLTQLTDSTQNSPFEDIGVAGGVMTTMPILSELSPHDVKSNNAERVIRNALGSVIYPFGFKVKLEKVQMNSDGLYCYFNIYEDEKWCGYFDYYYNTEKHCFSYREFAIATTLNPANGFSMECDVIAFDYKDIPVEKWNTDKPTFRIGQLKDNGEFENNGVVIQVNTSLNNNHVSFEINYPIMMSKNGVVASIFRPDECRHYALPFDQIGANSVYSSYYSKFIEVLDSLANVELEKRLAYLNMLETIELFTVAGFFTDFEELVDHIDLESPSGYESYEEYTSLSYAHIGTELSAQLPHMYENVDRKGFMVHDNASVYNMNNKKSASDQFSFKMLYHEVNRFLDTGHRATCQYCKNHSYQEPGGEGIISNGRPTLILVTNDSVENSLIRGTNLGEMMCKDPYSMFNDFYHLQGQYPEKDYGTDEDAKTAGINEYQIALATEHLKACGFSEEDAANYAANLIYSENQVFWNGDWFAKITAVSPSTFVTDFGNHQTEMAELLAP